MMFLRGEDVVRTVRGGSTDEGRRECPAPAGHKFLAAAAEAAWAGRRLAASGEAAEAIARATSPLRRVDGQAGPLWPCGAPWACLPLLACVCPPPLCPLARPAPERFLCQADEDRTQPAASTKPKSIKRSHHPSYSPYTSSHFTSW